MRYSLRSLFMLVTLAAVVCTVMFALPGGLAFVILLASVLCITPACVAGLVYGRGFTRAFAIGALTSGWWMSFGAAYYMVLVIFESNWQELIAGIRKLDNGEWTAWKVSWALCMTWLCLSGLTSAGVRWLVRLKSPAAAKISLHERVPALPSNADPLAPPLPAAAQRLNAAQPAAVPLEGTA